MHLALLASLASLAKQPDQLPLPISSLYSAHVLQNRPAHWPPKDSKGRRSRLAHHLIHVDGESEGKERQVSADLVDIKQTSAKKLVKWIKNAEKAELLKCKDIKGKDTVITSINPAHAE
jgi:hypothetical protein